MGVPFWRDLAVVWLSLFCFIGLLLPIALFYFAVRGLNSLHGLTQRTLWRGQSLSSGARRQVTSVSAQVDKQAVRLQGRLKQMEETLRRLTPGKQS